MLSQRVGVAMLQFHLQVQGVQTASQFLAMLPYLAMIVVLVLISRNAACIKANTPASPGKPFTPGVVTQTPQRARIAWTAPIRFQ